MNRPDVFDLHNTGEDTRIKIVGAMAQSKIVGIILEDDPEKIERYKAKLAERFPLTRFIDSKPGPTRGMVYLRFGPKGN